MKAPCTPPQILESNSGPRPMASVPIGNNSSPAPSQVTVQQPAPAPALQERLTPEPPAPPAISPDQILDHAPRKARILRMDANVVAYFGDMLHGLKTSVAAPLGGSRLGSSHKHPK